ALLAAHAHNKLKLFPRVTFMQLADSHHGKGMNVRTDRIIWLLTFSLWFLFTCWPMQLNKFLHLHANLGVSEISPANVNGDLFRSVIVDAPVRDIYKSKTFCACFAAKQGRSPRLPRPRRRLPIVPKVEKRQLDCL